MLKLIKVILLFFLLQLCLLQHGYADTSVEFGVEDDLTVNGTGGSSADADLEVKGYSLFGNTGAPAPLKVTSGAGSVYIQNNLELGGSGYLLGNSGIGTTEASARLQIKGADTGTGFTLRLQDSNKIDTAAFLDNGNVGLGTTAPITQLHIPGKVPASAVGSVATGTNPYSVYVQGRYAYVVNTTSGTLQIFDVSNPNSPSPVGSVATLSNPYSVYVQGRYAYVVDGIIPSSGALQIFDVSNPNSPSPVGSVATGTTPTFLYVQGRYAYVVHIGGTDSLQIYDVSNPASPTIVGSVATGANPYSVYVQGRYAYTANYSANTLQIFDVSNPASPTRVSSVATGTNPYSVYVQGRYAYVVHIGGTDSLQIYDVSNPASPSRVGSVVTGADPYSVYVQGRYAYVTYIGGTPDALQIFDVSSPSSPSSIGSVATLSDPYSVYVQGRYAYVANYSAGTLQIFDLGGSYIQQLETGGLETGTLSTRSNAQIGNDLDVRGGLQVGRGAEVTGPFSVYGGSGTGLIVNYNGNVGIGITLPQDKLTITGGTLSLDNQGDLRLYDADNSNYTGFQGSSNATANVTYTLPDSYGSSTQALSTSGTGPLYWVSTGGGITAVGSMTTGPVFAGVDTSGQWLGLGASAGRIQFRDLATDAVNLLDANVGVGTSTPAAKLHIVATGAATAVTLRVRDNANRDTFACLDNGNVGLGTTAPITQLHIPGRVPTTFVGSLTSDFSGFYSVYVQGRYAYACARDSPGFRIYDVSNPASPALLGSRATGTKPQSLYVQGRYAYVANYTSSYLQIIDISNPTSPATVSSVATGTWPGSVYIQGRYAYVLNSVGNTLQIFDVSNPASPSSVSSVATGSGPQSLYVQGRYAYTVDNGTDRLRIFDVSNPTLPTSVGSVATGNNPYSLYVQGRYTYLVGSTGTISVLQIYDVSNPSSPTAVSSITTGASSVPYSVYVQGRYAYVANYSTNALAIFDVSNPASPARIGSVATGTLPQSVYVQGRYAYVVNWTGNSLQIFDVGGSYIQQLEAGGIETATLSTRSNAQIGNDLDVRGGLQVGRGAEVTGPFAVYGGLVASGTDPSFVVNYNGNVGIGTSNPSAKLYIEGNLKAKMQTSMTGSLAKWEGGTDDAVYELGYDVAERFETSEPVTSGDLLVVSKPNSNAGLEAKLLLKKSTQAYQDNLIGVVSAAPAVLFEGSELQLAPQPFAFQTGTKPPVALSGRVKVKVTPENGPIRTGDYLTSSSKPGYAMKATLAGRVIGLALEDTTQETQITVFINPHWYGADLTRQRLAKLRAENAALKAKAQEFASRLKSLESK